jgi:hypothetical protein
VTTVALDTNAPRRAIVVVVLALVLAAAAFADRGTRARVAAAPPPDMAVAPGLSSVSSSWYCPGGGAQPDTKADTSVVVANPGSRPLTASILVVPSEGERVSRQLSVPPNGVQSLRLQDALKAPFAAALVEIDGGPAVVEQAVTGLLGASASPCASAASDQWHFADGSTRREASLFISLFNPFPDNAIASLAFSTDQGRTEPRKLQGLVVPARSLVVVDVGDNARRRETVATTVAVRSGRLVASKLQLHEGGGRKGMSLVLGAPSAGREWWFADGLTRDGVTETLVVYNPGNAESTVQVDLALEQGAAEPFDLTVPARDRVALVLNKESRVPKDDPHGITVTRRSGPDVVVERTVDALAPSPRTGFGDTMGSRRLSTRWYLAAGAANESTDEWVVVFNPGARPVQASFAVLAGGQRLPVDGLQGVSIPPGHRQAFRIGDHLQRAQTSMVVETTAPVVVERSLYPTKGLGFSMSVGVPGP